MAYKKGETGNPKGRPPKKRTLTDILEKVGNQKREVGGTPFAQKHLLATLLWEAATTGQITFPDGFVRTLDVQDWTGVMKFIYQHIDGPPKTEMEVTGANGGPIEMALVKGYATVSPDDWHDDQS